jgi:hypothetical protein
MNAEIAVTIILPNDGTLLDNLSKKSGANDAARTPIISLEKISPRK